MKNNIVFFKRNRSFTILWAAQTLSRLGDAFETIALMYLVLQLTGSALAMGTVMVCSFIPNILFSPLAGVLADRFSRKKIMLLSEIMRGIIILSIPVALLINRLTIYQIYLVAFLVSIFETFFTNANTASMPNLLTTDEDRTYGFTLYRSTLTVVQIIGFALSGLGLMWLNFPAVFMFDSITFFISGLSILFMTIPQQTGAKGAPGAEAVNKKNGFFKEFTAGLKYLKSKRIFIIILIVAAALNFILSPMTIVIVYATENLYKLDKSFVGIALIMILAGNLVGNVLYPVIGKFLKKRALTALAIVLIGIGLCAGAVFRFFPVFSGGVFLMSLSAGAASICLSLLFAEHIEDQYRGRAASVMNAIVLSGEPLSAALIGFILQTAGTIQFMLAGSSIIILLGFFLYILWPGEIKNG